MALRHQTHSRSQAPGRWEVRGWWWVLHLVGSSDRHTRSRFISHGDVAALVPVLLPRSASHAARCSHRHVLLEHLQDERSVRPHELAREIAKLTRDRLVVAEGGRVGEDEDAEALDSVGDWHECEQQETHDAHEGAAQQDGEGQPQVQPDDEQTHLHVLVRLQVALHIVVLNV